MRRKRGKWKENLPGVCCIREYTEGRGPFGKQSCFHLQKLGLVCPCQSAREACPQYQWRNPFAEHSGTARWKASTRRLSPSRTRSARRSVPTSSPTSSVSSPPTFWRESLSQGHSSVLLLLPLLLLLFKFLWHIYGKSISTSWVMTLHLVRWFFWLLMFLVDFAAAGGSCWSLSTGAHRFMWICWRKEVLKLTRLGNGDASSFLKFLSFFFLGWLDLIAEMG